MNFHKDNVIKIEYNPVLDAQIDYENAVGATDSLTLRTLDFTPLDANTIFVKKTGNDSTAVGTQADPVLTIKYAESLITATKTNIVILDDGVYEEESLEFDTNCANIAAAIGKMPTVKNLLVASSTNYLLETAKSKTAISTYTRDFEETELRTEIKCAPLSNGNFCIIFHAVNQPSPARYGLFFKIVDKDGNNIVSSTFVRGYNGDPPYDIIHHFDICSLNNGNFVITCSSVNLEDLVFTAEGHFFVYNNSGSLVASEKIYNTSTVEVCHCSVSPVGGYDDRFVIIFPYPSTIKYLIASSDGTINTSFRTLVSYAADRQCNIIPHPDNGFIASFKIAGSVSNKWLVVNNSGSVLHDSAILSGTGWCCGFLEDNLITFACGDSSNNLHFIRFDLDDYSINKADTTVTALSSASYIKAVKLAGETYGVVAGSSSGSLSYINSKWELISTESISSDYSIDVRYNSQSDRLILSYPNSSSPYYAMIYIKKGFLTDWWTFSNAVSFNGIIFDLIDEYFNKYINTSGASLAIKWCNIQNIKRGIYKDNSLYPVYVIKSESIDNIISNCKVLNNDEGFNIISNSVLIQYCQFFKQQVDSAIYINGAGTGIIINNNDFLYNYLCIELENNAGTEVIKNNIFYTSLLYAIKAETTVTYSHSVENSVSLNATPGNQIIRSNPHYINDGYVTINDMDLVLKSRELGYRFESPAIGIGDDLGNAGSMLYSIADGSRTWTTITVQKDRISRGYDPVGGIETVYKDGSVESYRDSYTEVLKLDWRVAINDNFDKLIALYFASKNLVRIYLDPISDPGVYGTYTLVYDKVNAATDLPKLSRTGKQSVSLTFKRAYNEGN